MNSQNKFFTFNSISLQLIEQPGNSFLDINIDSTGSMRAWITALNIYLPQFIQIALLTAPQKSDILL